MPIDTQHPDYVRLLPIWRKMGHALLTQDEIHKIDVLSQAYIPKTAGMTKNDTTGADYKAFVERARFPELPNQALTGIVGLVFEKDPIGTTDEVITNSNQTDVQLARDTVRATSSKGRDIYLIDAPVDGGDPFIAHYCAESLINWKTVPGNPAELSMFVLAEEQELSTSDEYSHETETVYRRYRRLETGQIEVTRFTNESNGDGKKVEHQVDAPRILKGIDFMPIEIVATHVNPSKRLCRCVDGIFSLTSPRWIYMLVYSNISKRSKRAVLGGLDLAGMLGTSVQQQTKLPIEK